MAQRADKRGVLQTMSYQNGRSSGDGYQTIESSMSNVGESANRIFDVISFRGSGAPEYLFGCRNSADESDGRILNLSHAGAAAALMEFAF